MSGQVGPVLTLLIALVAIWYAATVWMNADFARQIAADPAALHGTALVAATMSMERPVLPAPHQVVAELWRSVFTLDPTSKRSLVYHAWVTLAATLLGFAIGTAFGITLAVLIVHGVEHLDGSAADVGDVALFQEHEPARDGQQRGDV